MRYVIYTITDPRDDSVFYLGLTTNLDRRKAEHLDLSIRTRKEKLDKIKAILDSGSIPKFMEVATATSRERALVLETSWVSKLAKEGVYVLTGCKEHKKLIGVAKKEARERVALERS